MAVPWPHQHVPVRWSVLERPGRLVFHVTVVGLKRPGKAFQYAEADTVIVGGDQLIVTGAKPDLDRFVAEA